MGTPKHTYCSLRDLLKNQPSPPPKFKNHPCAKEKVPDLEDVYTSMPFKLSIRESLSPSKKPSPKTSNGSHGKGKMPAIGKPPMVESSTDNILNHEKSKQSFKSEEVVFASDENEELKVSFANKGNGDADKIEAEKKEEVESDEIIGEEKGVVNSKE